ncbi:tail fiber domain-containing protein [Pseudomonas sp. SMV71]|uniref:tail fiber domain-containing protein n=1 Tax=Pseudomonas sp. SMV71 TaxID=3390195 RepID=UPI003F83214D
MPWYKTGTVSVTLNSNAVTGTGTAFIVNSRVGDAFRGPDGRWYEVTNVASNTAISIDPPYQGTTATAGAYALAPMQGYVKDSADALRAIVNTYGVQLAALKTTGNYDILPVSKGGTGGVTDAEARSNLGLGNAAVAAVQTSPSDTTAGRVLTPGAFGWGGTGVSLTEANLNGTRQTQLNIVAAGGLGILPANINSYVFHWNNPSNGYAYQTCRAVTGGPEYTRYQVAGTWGPWDSRAKSGANTDITSLQAINSIDLMGSAYVDFHYNSSAADYTTRMIADSATNITIRSAGSPGVSIGSSFFPNADGGINCGTGSNRFAAVYAVTGTIQTSDAREKSAVQNFSEPELSAAMDLAREIGTYKWLTAIAEKGDAARSHIGMTVQRAVEIMESYGLDPLKYAFICFDEWSEVELETEEVVRGNIYSVGDLAFTNVPYSEFEKYQEFPAFTWEETSREIVVIKEAREAGNRYGFRYDQLALFIARGQEERLARLEALMAPAA